MPETPPYVSRLGVPIKECGRVHSQEFENDIVRLLGVEQKPKPPMRAPLNDTQFAAATGDTGTGHGFFFLF
jgi:hypothetical protein